MASFDATVVTSGDKSPMNPEADRGRKRMLTRKTLVVATILVAAGVAVAWASGDWSSARSAAEDMKSRQQELRKLTPEETRQIVTAICEADEDARESAGKSAAERVASDVNSKYEDLRHARDSAYRLLDDVIADDNLKDKRDEAKQLREEVGKRWDSITMMAERAMKGANHPLVSFLIKEGQDAHKDKQHDCDASEFTLDSGKRVDCIMASGETCLVIEFKPENSRAISSGVNQARGYAAELNDELKKTESSVIKKLIGIKSDFGKCKQFVYRVDCYKLCPSVDESGEFREAHPDWKKDCS